MSLQEDELPVLSAVVESGNPSIIQSTRMGNEVLRELETLRQDSARRFQSPMVQDAADTHTAPENTNESAKLHAGVLTDELAYEPAMDAAEENVVDVTTHLEATEVPSIDMPEGLDFASLAVSAVPSRSAEFRFSDDELELLIDDIVDRHITELRQDIKQLLERARRTP